MDEPRCLSSAAASLIPCLRAASCSLPQHHALLLGAAAATGMGELVPKKPGERGGTTRQQGEKGDGNELHIKPATSELFIIFEAWLRVCG